MEHMEYQYGSVFTLFSGFILFMLVIVDKIYNIIPVVDQYFVVFLFSALILSISGAFMAFFYQFSNATPFMSDDSKKTHFGPYFLFGVLLVILGLLVRYLIPPFHNVLFYISMMFSIGGIFLLLAGLRYFMTEVVRKNLLH